MTVNITLDTVDKVRTLARTAGAAIMKIYESGFTVETKSDDSPVTRADRLAEEIIVAGLRKLTAKFPIVAEEASEAGNTPDVTGQPFWLVDPLDGTKSFIKHEPEFTVNIALIDAGRPALGVVYAPASRAL